MKMASHVGVNLACIRATILAFVFANGTMVSSAPPITLPAKDVIRRFSAEIVAVDAGQGTVTVVHAPSG